MTTKSSRRAVLAGPPHCQHSARQLLRLMLTRCLRQSRNSKRETPSGSPIADDAKNIMHKTSSCQLRLRVVRRTPEAA